MRVLSLAASVRSFGILASKLGGLVEHDAVCHVYYSYYNKFGQESRAASPAFSPSRA